MTKVYKRLVLHIPQDTHAAMEQMAENRHWSMGQLVVELINAEKKKLSQENSREADRIEDLLRQSREEVIAHLNACLGLIGRRGYRAHSDKVKLHLDARLKEGYSPEECKIVNTAKVNEWRDDPLMAVYLRPETLYGPKFEGYLRVALLAKNKNGEDDDDELLEKIKAYKARKAAMTKETGGNDGSGR